LKQLVDSIEIMSLRGRRVNQLHHSAKEVEPKDT
jgi:hypothetical protein